MPSEAGPITLATIINAPSIDIFSNASAIAYYYNLLLFFKLINSCSHTFPKSINRNVPSVTGMIPKITMNELMTYFKYP